MTKEQIIHAATKHGIRVKETTYGIWNPYPVYSFAPANTERYKHRQNMCHVSCDLSRTELVSGILLMAERMGLNLTKSLTVAQSAV